MQEILTRTWKTDILLHALLPVENSAKPMEYTSAPGKNMYSYGSPFYLSKDTTEGDLRLP